MEQEAYKRLLFFLAEETGVDSEKLNSTLKIEDDLGVTGDDGIDLINKYGVVFHVDISDFDFKKYFYPEPSFFNITPRKVVDLTIHDLLNGIINGKLD